LYLSLSGSAVEKDAQGSPEESAMQFPLSGLHRHRTARQACLRVAAAFLAVAGLCPAMAQGIFMCQDASGRRITADRPIAECLDREQKELSAGGMVKRRITPVLTAKEVALVEEKQRMAAEERARATQAQQRDRALLARYPDLASHERDRTRALEPLERDVAATRQRLDQERSATGQLLLANQQEQLRQAASRFDQERARLQQLWGAQAQPAVAASR